MKKETEKEIYVFRKHLLTHGYKKTEHGSA